LLFSTAVPAQVVEKKTLTLAGAEKVVAAALSEVRRLKTTGAVAVVDDGGNLLALWRIDGTLAAAGRISTGKARTAALFKKATRAFEEIIGKGRTAMIALEDFTPLEGAIPLTVDGQIVGAVGVSGAASAQQDEELAVAAAAALSAPASPAEPSSQRRRYSPRRSAARPCREASLGKSQRAMSSSCRTASRTGSATSLDRSTTTSSRSALRTGACRDGAHSGPGGASRPA